MIAQKIKNEKCIIGVYHGHQARNNVMKGCKTEF